MPKYRHTKEEFKIIPQEEVLQMVKAVRDWRIQTAIILAWITGARIDEIMDLRGENVEINYEKDEVRLRLKTLKIEGHPLRELTLSIENTPFLEEILRIIGNKNGKIFNIGKRRVQQLLEKVNEKTGLDYTFHEFRHSRLTYLGRILRASVSEFMDWTGWKTPSQIGTYLIREAPRRFKDKIR